jgi:hypothetical protein
MHGHTAALDDFRDSLMAAGAPEQNRRNERSCFVKTTRRKSGKAGNPRSGLQALASDLKEEIEMATESDVLKKDIE